MSDSRRLGDKLWSYCNVLRDDGAGVIEYTEQRSASGTDLKGDAYEDPLSEGASDRGSGAGQYFTPRDLIAGIVDVVQPSAG